MSFDLLAKSVEQRLTLLPIYSPGEEAVDLHGEFVRPEVLEQAIFALAKSGSREVTLQHAQDGAAVGELLTAFVLPWEVERPVFNGAGIQKGTRRFPPYTAFGWFKWSPEAFRLIRSGLAKGVSIEGRAKRRPMQKGGSALTRELRAGWSL